jgi:hypothetical protein
MVPERTALASLTNRASMRLDYGSGVCISLGNDLSSEWGCRCAWMVLSRVGMPTLGSLMQGGMHARIKVLVAVGLFARLR